MDYYIYIFCLILIKMNQENQLIILNYYQKDVFVFQMDYIIN